MMFFSHPPFAYQPRQKPFILALSADAELSDIRIRPYLAALLAREVIAGFQFADRKLVSMGWHKDFSFTHIWCHRNVSSAQYRFLQRHRHVPIIYDLDDLMTDPPDFMKYRPRIVERVRWCLQNARAVTTSTDVLQRHLRALVPSDRPVILLKNGHVGYEKPQDLGVRKQIVWTSGDHPFVIRSYPQFVNHLAEIANRYQYGLLMIGRFDPAQGELFHQFRHIRRLDFDSYRELLRYSAGGIGLAPLPSGLSAQNQQFYDAKSDIKLLDYLSSGLVPVTTLTPPYADSELHLPELSAENPADLLQRLEACIADHPRWIESLKREVKGAVLEQRTFGSLSHALDMIFESR